MGRARDDEPRHTLIVTNNFPPSFGGIQTYMVRLAEEISALGRSVTVVAPAIGPWAAYDARLPYRVIRYRTFGTAPFANIFALATISLACARALRLAPSETIASAWWPGGLVASLFPRGLRGRLVTIAHGMEIKPGVAGLRRWIMRFAYRRSAHVVANSSFTRDLLALVGITANVSVVPCGVEVRIIPRNEAPEPTVLSVGRLVPRKGFDRMIDAIAALVPSFPTLQYVIVGQGPDRARLERAVRERGLDRHVSFRSSVADAEMLAAYGSAWCFALPARRIEDDVEGFGIVYLEAAMAELVSIGGRDSGAIDAIADGETGLLVDGNDTAALTAALRTMLVDRRLARRMGEEARRRAVAGFGWPRVAQCVLSDRSR